jgi:hypothetical protein
MCGTQLGVIPEAHKEAVVQTLVDDVAAHGYHLNVGIVGAKFLFPTLAEAGRGDVALMVSQQKTVPGYVYMVEQGATTLWETWYSTRYVPGGSPSRPKGSNGVPSWNHVRRRRRLYRHCPPFSYLLAPIAAGHLARSCTTLPTCNQSNCVDERPCFPSTLRLRIIHSMQIMYGGGTSEFYFKHLAGIQQAPTSRGWEQIVLKPVSLRP